MIKVLSFHFQPSGTFSCFIPFISSLCTPYRSSPKISGVISLTMNRKREFFQSGAVSVLLYGCTNWTQMRTKKNLQNSSCTPNYLPSQTEAFVA